LPLTIENNLPFIHAWISFPGRSAINAKILIDTGANPALVLNRPFVDRNKLLDSIPRTIESPDVGVSGEANGRMGRVLSLQLGRFVIEKPITSFSRSRNGALAAANNDGLIGGEVLGRFAVILDYRRQRMVIAPNEDFSQPYESGMSGALLTAEGADLNTVKVNKTIEDSP